MRIYNLDIAMFVSGLPFDGSTIPSGKSLGGSETSAIQMAEALTKQGHRVSIFCNCEEPKETNGVLYSPIGWVNNNRGGFPKGFYDYIRSVPTDVCIVQRIPSMFQFETRAKVNLLWQHDLATRTGPSQFQAYAWNIDRILVLSQFMKKQYQEVHGGPDAIYHLTRNGIDLDAINAVPTQQRDRFRMTYTARPERGLDILLRAVFPKILQREPRAKLYISRYQDPNVMEFYAQLENEMKRFGDRIEFFGNLGKKALYENYKKSRLYIYPSMFEEISPLRGDAVIDMPDERATIEDLYKRDKRDFWVWSYSHLEKRMVLGKAHRVVKTRMNTPMLTIRMKPTTGCKAKCESTLTLTPDHEVMLRDGSYKKAENLIIGDRLMPFARTPGFGRFKYRGGVSKYWYVTRENLADRVPEHRYVAELMLGRKLHRNEIVDHIDSDTNNNGPNNLQVWSSNSEHQKDHWKRLADEERDRRTAEKIATIHKFHASLTKEEMHSVKRRAALIGWGKIEENHVVVAVEKAENADAYCMQVDDTHNFVANGIVVHNCLTAMETSACGLVFLGPWRAALPETIGGCAPLIKDDGFLAQFEDAPETGLRMPSQSFIDGIIDQAVRLMRDDEYHAYWQSKALARSASLSWDKVAQDWIELSHNIIAEKSGNDRRLVRHFLFNSDVVAARKFAVKKNDKALVQSVENYINRYVPFMSNSLLENQKPTINQFYEQRSGGVNANYSTGFFADKEVRLIQLKEFLRPKIQSGEIKTLLDFGCAHGGYARSLTDEFPTLQVVGIDNSWSLVRCCNEMKAAIGPDGKLICKNPQNMEFIVGDENGPAPQSGLEGLRGKFWSDSKAFDCVVSMEVLEHLPNAEEAATKLEALCKPDGWVVFTVPSGHRERDELVTKNIPPVHVRSFDLHDIRDLFGQKPNYWVTSFSDLQEAAMDRSFSCWFMVTFQADHKKIGSIDYERKFFLQGPRQTLAVCVIAHNSEDVMHRCLRSVVKYADQIVIVDNGPSNDRTAEIAGEYTDDVREGTSPFWCYTHAVVHPPEVIDPNTCEMAGFETPRNESTEGIWTDAICWIDCDEQLLEAANLPKYLRPNIYTGYAIQQHHISIDALAAMKRDVPVRLYRNIPGMRFYGLVHEHAELGINKGIGANVMVISDVHIHHDGYLVESIRRDRFKRNLRLLQCDRKKYPDRLLGWFLYEIRDCQHMARYAMEQNGGAVTDEVRQMCETTINAYRTKFMKEQMMMSDDAMQYYSNALAILGLGIDVSADIEIAKQGTAIPPQKTVAKFRAMDPAEAIEMIRARVNMAAAPHMGRYVQ